MRVVAMTKTASAMWSAAKIVAKKGNRYSKQVSFLQPETGERGVIRSFMNGSYCTTIETPGLRFARTDGAFIVNGELREYTCTAQKGVYLSPMKAMAFWLKHKTRIGNPKYALDLTEAVIRN